MISRRVSCPAIRFFRQEKITMLKAALIHVIIVLVLVTPFFNKGLAKKCEPDSSETEYFSEHSYEPWNPSLSSHQNGDCNCTFNYQTDLMTAYIGNRTLSVSEAVKRGERVTFKCRYDSMDPIWQNTLRFYKRVDITCYVCQKWERYDLPHCEVRNSVDSYVDYNPKMNFLPGGIIEIQKTENITLKCKNFAWQPRWSFQSNEELNTFREPIETVIRTKYFSETMILSNLDFRHSGKYECSTPNYFGKPSKATTLDLRVIAPCLSDPPSIQNAVSVVTNINHRAVMWYNCNPGFEKKKFGLMKCDNGTWVGDRPICDEKYKDCGNFTNDYDIEVFYTHDVRVGSIAIFLCPPATRLVGQSYAICRRWGIWSHPLPTCEVPSCSIETLMLSLTEYFVDLRNITDEFVPIDSEVILECKESASLMGNPRVTCGSSGEWEVGEVMCIPDVPGCELKINVTSQLQLRVKPLKKLYEFGEFVLLSCPPGLKLNKETERVMCLGEVWSDTLPECV